MNETVPTHLNTAGVARLALVTEGTVRNWRSAGIGPAYFKNPNGRAVYRRDDVIAWMEFEAVTGLDQKRAA